MLVLTRHNDEDVVIQIPPSDTPTRVIVKQCEVRGDKARLGFIAPPEVTINRKEIQDLIDRGEGYKR